MKKLFYIGTLILLMIIFSVRAMAQSKLDSLRQAAQNRPTTETYYRAKYGLDSFRVRKIARIEKNYRTAILLILKDSGMDDSQKKKKMHALLAEKKMQLKAVIGNEKARKSK